VLGGPAVLRWLAVALCLTIAVHCLVRVSIAGHRVTIPGLRRDIEGSHGVMALAMAGMFSPLGDPVPSTVWVVAFAVLAGWFGRRAWQTRNLSRAAVRADPHVHHVVAALAMVFMEGALALHGAAASSGSTMAGMAGGSGSFPVAFASVVVSVGLLCYFLLYAAWSLATVVRVPAGLVLAGTGTGTGGGSGAGVVGEAGGVHPAVRLVLSPRVAVCCQTLMGLGMAYMLLLMR
jgi:hypothetical protein